MEHALAIYKLTLRIKYKLDSLLLLNELAKILVAAQLSNFYSTFTVIWQFEVKVGLLRLHHVRSLRLLLICFRLRLFAFLLRLVIL
jgi:hypothetical protein